CRGPIHRGCSVLEMERPFDQKLSVKLQPGLEAKPQLGETPRADVRTPSKISRETCALQRSHHTTGMLPGCSPSSYKMCALPTNSGSRGPIASTSLLVYGKRCRT